MTTRIRDFLITWRLSLASMPRIILGRWRRQSFVPHPRTYIFIEPTTHCNLACKFCTYRLDLRPHAVMSEDSFNDYATQALALGFEHIALTPINGDAFVDKAIMDKIRFLAAQPRLKGILLYTNLIAANAAAIAEIVRLDKITTFNISIYGHDRDSFEAVAGRGQGQYQRLLDNLDHLAAAFPTAANPAAFQISVRTSRYINLSTAPGELAERLRRLGRLGIEVSRQSRCDDWGGLIDQTAMDGLDMELIKGRHLFKLGACTLPFNSIQILADGRVNACACRDISGQLQIGDMKRQSLAEILSADNAAYVGLIEGQERGRFADACKGCSFYRSIYDPTIRDASPKGAMSLDQFWRFLGRS